MKLPWHHPRPNPDSERRLAATARRVALLEMETQLADLRARYLRQRYEREQPHRQ